MRTSVATHRGAVGTSTAGRRTPVPSVLQRSIALQCRHARCRVQCQLAGAEAFGRRSRAAAPVVPGDWQAGARTGRQLSRSRAHRTETGDVDRRGLCREHRRLAVDAYPDSRASSRIRWHRPRDSCWTRFGTTLRVRCLLIRHCRWVRLPHRSAMRARAFSAAPSTAGAAPRLPRGARCTQARGDRPGFRPF